MPRTACSAFLLSLANFAAFYISTIGQAQDQPATGRPFVANVKAACAIVDLPKNVATAFCVDGSGLYVTNASSLGNATSVRLIFRSGQTDEIAMSAKVIRQDKDLGLALLRVGIDDDKSEDKSAGKSILKLFDKFGKSKGKSDTKPDAKPAKQFEHKPLPLGHDESLTELADVFRAGFPYPTLPPASGDEVPKKRDYPAIAFDTGRIVSLKRKNGELDVIETNMPPKVGIYGGPLLDGTGIVVGVLGSRADDAKSSLAIPVNRLRRMMTTPDVDAIPPTVAYADRYKKATFKVKAAAPLPSKEPYQVSLILIPKNGPERLYRMKLDKDVYAIDADVLIAPSANAPVDVTVEYSGGQLKGALADQSISIGGSEVRLSTLRRLTFGQEPTAVMADGKVVKGAVKGLGEIELSLGTATVKADPLKAMSLTVAPPVKDSSVDYRVVVQSGGKEIANVRNRLRFAGVPFDSAPTTNLNGLWLLENAASSDKIAADRNGEKWPREMDEAMYVEGTQVLWVTKDGKIPYNAAEFQLTIDASQSPGILTFTNVRGAHGKSWSAIFRVEDGALSIATNFASERPQDFTTDVDRGGAHFVRTYRKSKN